MEVQNSIYKYDYLLDDYKLSKLNSPTFEESLAKGFYIITYTKIDDWYYIDCVTSDINFKFRILPDWKTIYWWWKTDFMWNSLENFLEIEQTILSMWGLKSMWQYPNDQLKIIPIEKLEKLNLENYKEYLSKIIWYIEENLEEYRSRVSEIIKNWSEDL